MTADEIPRRCSRGNMAANSWSVPFFIISVAGASHILPTTISLVLHLSFFVFLCFHNFPHFSLPHCRLSICRLFSLSPSLWFGVWFWEARWCSQQKKKIHISWQVIVVLFSKNNKYTPGYLFQPVSNTNKDFSRIRQTVTCRKFKNQLFGIRLFTLSFTFKLIENTGMTWKNVK